MLQLAQDMYKLFQERFRTTLKVVADLAESVGVPPSVTSLLHGIDRADTSDTSYRAEWERPPAATAFTPAPREENALSKEQLATQEAAARETPVEKKRSPRKYHLAGSVDLSDKVRSLKVDDAINGSTYLARIIWTLGVADLEGIGPLRPADIARMIMSRSPVSLEPPNVARYIRRSKPSCIVVDHTEGSSHFYRLNEEGQQLFSEKFRPKK